MWYKGTLAIALWNFGQNPSTPIPREPKLDMGFLARFVWNFRPVSRPLISMFLY